MNSVVISLATLFTGVLIFIFPEILNYVIAIYLILMGIAGLVWRAGSNR